MFVDSTRDETIGSERVEAFLNSRRRSCEPVDSASHPNRDICKPKTHLSIAEDRITGIGNSNLTL